MKTNKILVLLALIMMAITTHAQEEKPSIDMTATFIDSEGKEVTTTTFEGSMCIVFLQGHSIQGFALWLIRHHCRGWIFQVETTSKNN